MGTTDGSLSPTDSLEVRLREGDPQALAELFARERDRLWRMVSFRLAEPLRARLGPDDVLQEAFLDASQRLGHYKDGPSRSPFVWLRMVVNQTLVDLHRRHLGAQKRDLGREVALWSSPFAQTTSASVAIQLIGAFTSPSQAAARAEAVSLVEQAIEQMDPIDREVLVLRHFEELTNTEVAETLGIEQKAASIRYVRALRRLKEILAEVPALSDEAHRG
jgi:RNA polymerase sigma-70 factor (ECF subfamily)